MFIFGGLAACLWTSAVMLLAAFIMTLPLRNTQDSVGSGDAR